MTQEIQEKIGKLSAILQDGQFPSDLSSVAGWGVELKKATVANDLLKHPALMQFWQMFETEVAMLTNVLTETPDLQNREIIFKYRNFLRGLLATFRDSQKRIDQINKRVDDELTNLKPNAES